jgi:hypothetical protein
LQLLPCWSDAPSAGASVGVADRFVTAEEMTQNMPACSSAISHMEVRYENGPACAGDFIRVANRSLRQLRGMLSRSPGKEPFQSARAALWLVFRQGFGNLYASAMMAVSETVAQEGNSYAMKTRERAKAREAIRQQKRGIASATRCTVIEILRRGSVYDTNDPQIIEWACEEQERLAKMIERRDAR